MMRRDVASWGYEASHSPGHRRVHRGALAARVPALLREIVERQQPVRFDRAHLRDIGETGLEYELVYIVLTPDYNAHMDIQQAITLAVLERFRAEGVLVPAVFRAVTAK